MKIFVDAFGGDHAPLEIIRGCAAALPVAGAEITLVGDEGRIRDCAAANGIALPGLQIKHAPDVITMHDSPKSVLKEKAGSSMAAGLRALAEGGADAFVSAGSTGALTVGATFIVKRIRGVKRAAIASVMPSNSGPFMLLDCGANADCTAQYLGQFAVMGDIYMSRILGIESPRVALANIGTEDTKGDKLRLEAFALMKGANYNFTGNIEARDIPYGCCDVLVADGFTGNIILKMYEGVAGALMSNIKDVFYQNPLTKLSALAVKPGLTALKKKMDYTAYGGAPLIGLNGAVIKAHGSSNATAIKNAILQARDYVRMQVIDTIKMNIRNDADENGSDD